MPANAPSVETVNALIRLGGGALDIYLFLIASADEDGWGRMTEAEVAQGMGRSVRWVSKSVVALKQAGYLQWGRGFWRLPSPPQDTTAVGPQAPPNLRLQRSHVRHWIEG